MERDQIKAIAVRFTEGLRRDDVPGLAAELAFRFLFALFPFGLFVAALGAFVAGWLGVQNPVQAIVAGLGDNLPPDLASSIRPDLEQVLQNGRAELVWIGALGALWAATGGTLALVKAMNRAYDVEETRGVVHRYGLGAGLTILGGAIILVSFVTIVGGALITQQIATRMGLSEAGTALVTILRWPVVFAFLVLATAILFRYAPNARVAWRWTLAGGAVFAFGWLVATYVLAWWIGNIGSYGATYGSLGSVIVLMLWFYVTGLLLVGSAELIATIASVVEPEALQRRRDEIEAARSDRMVEEAGRKAGEALDRVREALPGGDEPDKERRTGPPDRRRTLDRPGRRSELGKADAGA
jgi:membrane protein